MKEHLASPSISFPSESSPFLPAMGTYLGGEALGVTFTSTVQITSKGPEQVDGPWFMCEPTNHTHYSSLLQ